MRPYLLAPILLTLLACQQPPVDTARLIELARKGDAAATVSLVQRLGQDGAGDSDAAYKALIGLGPKMVPLLLDGLETLEGDFLEYRIAALGSLRAEAALEALSRILSRSDGKRRYVAAWALGEIGGEKVVPALVSALSDTNSQVRRSATRALIKLNRTASPALIEALQRTGGEAQAAAVRALGDIQEPGALEPLLRIIQGENREEVLLALGKLKDSRAESALIAGLTDADWRNRLSATMALGPTGGEASVPHLQQRLEDDIIQIREWAARSLQIITGKPQRFVNAKGQVVAPYSVYH